MTEVLLAYCLKKVQNNINFKVSPHSVRLLSEDGNNKIESQRKYKKAKSEKA